jgi:(+)-pinoresinol hydroxylase
MTVLSLRLLAGRRVAAALGGRRPNRSAGGPFRTLASTPCKTLFAGMPRKTLLVGILAAIAANAAFSQETDSVARGKTVFERYCAACHGDGGGDESEAAAALPGTLALRLKYQGTTPALLEQRTDLSAQSIRAFIRNGVASMPPFRPTEVTDEDIEAIAEFLAQHRD